MKIGAICLASMLTATAQADPADVGAADAYWWWGTDQAGTSRIVRTDKGISGNISVHLGIGSKSAKGLAVTLLLVIFNKPDACEQTCSDSDLLNSAVMPDVVYAGGNVVGASEKTTIGFHYKAGENSGSVAALFNDFGFPVALDNGEGYGLVEPRGAEVHYVLRFHGPVVPAEMPAQINSYLGGCTESFDFPGAADELALETGQCQDVIAVVNAP